ncbi:20804_t:CDS:2, partial [Gigaspora margarita]
MKPTMPKVDDHFESLEEFEDAAKSAAKVSGFAFSRKDSNLTERKGTSLYVVLQCTKGGEWRNNWSITEKTQKRKRNTRREGCPVYIRAKAKKCYTNTNILSTEIKWIVTKAMLEHDHPLLELNEVATFPQYRAMNLNQKNLVQQLHNSNTPTRIIMVAVNNIIDGGIIFSKDIINERARIRLALNEGSNNDPTQRFLKLLEERDYMVVLLKLVKGYLTHLFFSHIESAKWVAKCPEVLIMDSIYKTNIYKYPLVSAVGITNISNDRGALASYQIAMAWIEDKSEASYIWFLQTLRKKIYNAYGCLPNVFMSDRDQALRNASSKVFLESNKMLYVEALRFASFEEEIPRFLDAIKKTAEKARSPEKIESYLQTWMKDSKTWIYAYTKQYCHMGISTTGRSESSHSAFKWAIETASDLESVFRQIDQAMRLQHLKAAVNTGSNKVAVDPFILRNPRFSELIGNISVWAINKIKQTLQKYKELIAYKSDEICECTIKINYKLPCIHMIPKHGPIPLATIDNRWLLERPDIIELPHPSKSAIVDSEFYDTFVNAEEKFQQLPNNIVKTEFITRINQVISMPLPTPIKLPQKSKNITIQQQNIPLKQIFNPSDYKLYEANIHQFMREHVLAYLDVVGDGNCGFRAIAVSIRKPEECWPEIRKIIYNELCIRKSHYIQLLPEKEKEYNEIKYSSLTFLPDNIPLNRNTSIAFAYILERQHFIAIKLKPNVPVPPIISGWEDICSEKSKLWKNLFVERITHFKKGCEEEYKYLEKENLEYALV